MYVIRNKGEKQSIVKRDLSGEAAKVLAREIDCSGRQVRNWTKACQQKGEAGLEVKKEAR